MKPKICLLMAAIIASAGVAYGQDAGALWGKHCASCHGKDGSGGTAMGKKLGVKDYTKEQGFSDAEAQKAIMDGMGKMKGFKGKVSEADAKALVAYIRSLKK